MQTKLAERVFETTTTTGTGVIQLSGAVTGSRTFASAFSNNTEVCYGITVESSGQYEFGVGTFLTNPSRIQRDFVTSSSSSNVKVDWGIGVKNVFSSPPTKFIPLLDKATSNSDVDKVMSLDSGGTLKPSTAIKANSITEHTSGSGLLLDSPTSVSSLSIKDISEFESGKGVNAKCAINFFTPQTIAGNGTIGVFNISTSNTFHVTGSGWTCTSLGSNGVAGMVRTLIFDGIGTLQNSSNLIIPYGNMTTAAGDVATFLAESPTVARCLTYSKADGTAVYTATVVYPGIVAYTASPTSPSGWIKANGAALSRTNYAALFSNIQTYWGAGDGLTTFNIPDLRGLSIRGWDDGRGIDTGRAFASYQEQQMLSHRHGFAGGGGQGGGIANVGNYGNSNNYVLTGGGTDAYFTSYEGGAELRVKNMALLPLIKY
jgi:microcystin-dependent protein